MKQNSNYENCIVLLMGFAGVGKLTTAKELVKHPNFKLADNHTWINPVFSLIQQDGLTPIPKAAWKKVGKIFDIVFETMQELSPSNFSFVLTGELIEGDEYPKIFYQRICQLAESRKSVFLPVRLECNEEAIVKRVKNIERRKHCKTIDADRSARLTRDSEVFHTNHRNEITIDNTDKSPEQVINIILKHLNKITVIT